MINFFQILSLPEQFQIDKNSLRQKYFSLQNKFHPDKFIKASEEEKIKALQVSADINEAFRVLSDDLLRAEHLLALEGVVVNKEKDNTYTLPKALLLEQMELRERADEINSHANVTPHLLRGLESHNEVLDPVIQRGDFENEEWIKFQSEIQQKIKEAIASFEQSFKKKDLEKASEAVTRLRYLEKIL